MTIKTLAMLSLAVSSFAGCTTTKEDVAATERDSETQTADAFAKADEKALQAQDIADATSEKAVDQAESTIEKAAVKADQDTAKAYADAQETQQKAEQKVVEVSKKEYVQSMSKKLAEHHTGIRHMERSLKKQSAADKEAKQPKLAAIKADESSAKAELAKLKNASNEDWQSLRTSVDDAFAKLEKDYEETKATW